MAPWDTDWGVEVSTPRELFRLISNLALLDKSRTYAWRGQNDAAWRLTSSLLRRVEETVGTPVTEATLAGEEAEILKEARSWGLGRDLGASATDLHMLATLQHHGVPTRLIDVTSNPLTALWFAIEEHRPDKDGNIRESPGVLFAIDVTGSDWYETFQHNEPRTYDHLTDPLGASYKHALIKSQADGFFRAFPALPDERMKAQEGFFLGSALPKLPQISGVDGFNPVNATAPGLKRLARTAEPERGRGRPPAMPFCAIVISDALKKELRDALKHTYNRRRRVLFPDIDGFREGYVRGQLD